MQSKLLKYKIGLAVVGGFVAILFIFLLVQASASRHDIKAYSSATKIAEQLNTYVSKNESIPDSLDKVGAKDVPDSITYHKNSEKSYKFCVTYKVNSNNVSGGELLNNAVSAYYGGGLSYSNDYTGGESLYIPSTHKKGQTCQTITPYFYSSYYDSSSSSDYSSNPYTYSQCNQDYGYSWSVLKVVNVIPKQGSAPGTIAVNSVPPSTYELDPAVKVFDQKCNPLTLNSLSPGDYVDLYFTEYGSPVTMIVKG